jgi:DNA polymerase elongation subunit (family B)
MSYIDAMHVREKDQILVVERVNGERVHKTLPCNYTLYYPDTRGNHVSIFGDALSKYSTNNGKAFNREKNILANKRLFESDVNPVFRSLEENYRNIEAPALNIAFFDIEVAFDTKRGFAPTEDPFNNVTAISVYLSWANQLVTLCMPPPGMAIEEAQRINDKFENSFLFEDEGDMLKAFLDIIEDSDVITGWNSTGFDVPYLVNRITRVISKDETRRFCLWNQLPRRREYIKFKKKSITYDTVGRIHLDYLELYQKHNPQQLHSYRLDFVGEIEVKENKTVYEGTLDDLYKKDFERFLEYNRQDVMLMVKIDAKKKFIELANQIAHTNCVLLKTTNGSVALIENSIMLEAHDLGMVIPDRKAAEVVDDEFDEEFDSDDDDEEDLSNAAVGAYVAKPKTGIQDEIGCCDINSLYPSTLRALNMSPETLYGHIRPLDTEAMIAMRIANKVPKPELWENVFSTLEYDKVMARTKDAITVDFEDGTTKVFRADELYNFIFHEGRPLCITANGTIFRTDKVGVIPSLLATWYRQRKEMQAREKTFAYVTDKSTNLAKTFDADPSAFISEVNGLLPTLTANDLDSGAFTKALYKKDAKVVAQVMVNHNFVIEDGRITANDEKDAKYWKTFWNQRQQARKILLNSLYGALLNSSMKFYDKRIGQSVTLTGRSIAKHMNSKINEIITGEYDFKGEAIIYADTDSSYFSAKAVWQKRPEYASFEFTRDNIIQLYDGIGDAVNESFPEFMHKGFNTGIERGGIIAAGRELVASKGLFIKKKKYAVLMYDKEGERYDIDGKPGKLKVMGLDLKRSDTPQYMQDFLEDVLMATLTGKSQDEIFDMIKVFRKEFRNKPGWEKGSPKKCNGLTEKTNMVNNASAGKLDIYAGHKANEKKKRDIIAGHVLASINYMKLRKMHNDNFSMSLTDGQKIIVCKLKPNPMGMTSIAYPIDEPHLPQWFKELPFDHTTMEETIIDFKLNNLLGVLKWDLTLTNEDVSNDLFKW